MHPLSLAQVRLRTGKSVTNLIYTKLSAFASRKICAEPKYEACFPWLWMVISPTKDTSENRRGSFYINSD